MADSKRSVDRELKAIQEVVAVLSGLEPTAVSRVLKYSLDHLGISMAIPGIGFQKSESEFQNKDSKQNSAGLNLTSPIVDIKTLKESKSPSSGIEMVVLVGYYLSECAPEHDRKHEFGAKDAEKYFKQAQFKLPPKMRFTLNNARNAGYIDSAGQGKFRLNPVGYNLVAHHLPSKSSKK